ncbi:MAG: sodium/panthothenate symporter, partial [Moorella sp. (in: Bacteria)]|nr:sodium/panthothenate symporter [Moorella sp. (in: firmicutes)]
MRDVRVARSALVICTIFSMILAWCLLPSGMMARLVLKGVEIKNPDTVIPLLISQVLHPALAGIFIAGILAAI